MELSGLAGWSVQLGDRASLVIDHLPGAIPLPAGSAAAFAIAANVATVVRELVVPLPDARLLALRLRPAPPASGAPDVAPDVALIGSLVPAVMARDATSAGGWPTFTGGGRTVAFSATPRGEVQLTLGAVAGAVAIVPGQAELTAAGAGGCSLAVVLAGDANAQVIELRAHASAGCTLTLALDLAIRRRGELAVDDVLVVGYQVATAARLLALSRHFDADADVRLIYAVPGGALRADFALWHALAGGRAQLPFLAGALFQSIASAFDVELDLSAVRAEFSADAVKLSNVVARLRAGGRELVATGALTIRDDFALADAELTAALAGGDLWLFDSAAAPMTIHVLAGTSLAVGLDAGGAAVRFTRTDHAPVAELFVPGVDPPHDTRKRFAFSLWSDGETGQPAAIAAANGGAVRCRMTPAGAEFVATLSPRAIDLGDVLPGAATVDGAVVVQTGTYIVTARGTAALPWFAGSHGTLTVVGGNGTGAPLLGVRFDVALDHTWTDPSGVLAVEHPSAWVSVAWQDHAWDVDGGASGALVFRPPSAGFGEGAAEWLGALFSSISVEFANLSLREFGSIPAKGIGLNLRLAHPIHVGLWNLLDFSLDDVAIHAGGIALGGDLSLGTTVVSLRGRLPSLRIGLDRGHVSFGLGGDGDGGNFAIHGALEVPSGVSAQIDVARVHTAVEDTLFGAGTLTIPGLPGIRVAVDLGRNRTSETDDWHLAGFLYIEADIPVPVFPGVVLRKEGVGFGIHKQLAGFQQLIANPSAGIAALLGSASGIPDPGALDGWENAGTAMVALRTRVTADQQPEDELQPYVLDLVLGVDAQLDLVVFASGWLFAKLASTSVPAFRARPVATGIIGLFPRQCRLEARFTTRQNPATDADVPLLGELLGMVKAQVALVATPEQFQLQIGPITGDAQFLGLAVHAGLLALVEVGKGRAVVLSHVELNASFSAGVGVQLGPLAVRVSLAARFAYDCTYLGGIDHGALLLYGETRISASADLRVELELHIHIHIDLVFGSIDIDIYIHFAAELSIGFDASVEAVIGTRGAGLTGSGAISVSLFGFGIALSVPFTIGDAGAIADARGLARDLILESGR